MPTEVSMSRLMVVSRKKPRSRGYERGLFERGNGRPAGCLKHF